MLVCLWLPGRVDSREAGSEGPGRAALPTRHSGTAHTGLVPALPYWEAMLGSCLETKPSVRMPHGVG